MKQKKRIRFITILLFRLSLTFGFFSHPNANIDLTLSSVSVQCHSIPDVIVINPLDPAGDRELQRPGHRAGEPEEAYPQGFGGQADASHARS